VPALFSQVFAGAVWQGADGHAPEELQAEVARALAQVALVEPGVAPLLARCIAALPHDRISLVDLRRELQILCSSPKPKTKSSDKSASQKSETSSLAAVAAPFCAAPCETQEGANIIIINMLISFTHLRALLALHNCSTLAHVTSITGQYSSN
jgi:hypothetical protein